MLHIKHVLNAQEIAQCASILAHAPWADGKITAGLQAATAKNNYQLPEMCAEAIALRDIVLVALSRHPIFFSAALPKQIYPPLFNRYADTANAFGNHVDNAIRTHAPTAKHTRTDLSFTLFLNNPEDYDGGELIIENGMGGQAVKLPAGDLILYPSYSVHRVEPVTKGQRLACFSWLQSMVRDPQQRQVLFDMDMALLTLRQTLSENEACVSLTSCYHNLLRMWAEI